MKKLILWIVGVIFLLVNISGNICLKSLAINQIEDLTKACIFLKNDLEVKKVKKVDIWKDFFSLVSFVLHNQDAKEIIPFFSELIYEFLKEIKIETLMVNFPQKKFVNIKKLEKFVDKNDFYRILKEIINSKNREDINDFLEEVFFIFSIYFENDVKDVVEVIHYSLSEYLANKRVDVTGKIIYKGKKKKKKIAAAIFGALANACVHSAQIATSQSTEEKQQGVLNLLGTVFGLASQVVVISANEEKGIIIEDDYDKILDLTAMLVENVCDLIKHDGINVGNDMKITLLVQISKLDSDLKRRESILNYLVSQSLAQNILDEAFSYLRQYLHYKVDDLIDFLRDNLIYLIFGNEYHGGYYSHVFEKDKNVKILNIT
ncbi:hypothetical protein KAT08_01120 [Candidatus Babeliales bacterium]|nr:hypothetical protein [Candidatus Babeliales bacterium]